MEKKPLYGCSLIDAYQIQSKLGEGTFGEVHRGLHKDTQTAVAVKEILLHNKDDGMPLTALREIRILKALDHANVLDLLDMAVKRGSRSAQKRATFYIITPYMDHDLAGLLRNPKVRFTLPHIKCYMLQILQGMNYLHQQHYMHRDIKAANILIDNRGQVKLADFGLARKYFEAPPTAQGATAAANKYTAMVVTRWYRPPELLLGDRYYTTAIDMWGVGCVFGEIFNRKPIFPGKSDTDQITTIFKVLGSPTDSTMPGFESLPGAHHVPQVPLPSTFDESLKIVPPIARKLLLGMLDLNPLIRLSALGALDHEFFKTGPPASNPRELPIYTSSHELDAKNRRHEEQQRPDRPPLNGYGNGYRPRPLGYKLNNRPVLSGQALIPPYRRNNSAQSKPADASKRKRVELDY